MTQGNIFQLSGEFGVIVAKPGVEVAEGLDAGFGPMFEVVENSFGFAVLCRRLYLQAKAAALEAVSDGLLKQAAVTLADEAQ